MWHEFTYISAQPKLDIRYSYYNFLSHLPLGVWGKDSPNKHSTKLVWIYYHTVIFKVNLDWWAVNQYCSFFYRYFIEGDHTFLCDRLFFVDRTFKYILCARAETAHIIFRCSNSTPAKRYISPLPFQDALFPEIKSEILSEIKSEINLEILSGIFRRRSRRKIRSLLAQLNKDSIGDGCRRLNQEINKRFFWRLIQRYLSWIFWRRSRRKIRWRLGDTKRRLSEDNFGD